MSSRRRIIAGIGVAAAVAAVLWLRREPAWGVSLSADRDAPVTPWQSIDLVARIEPLAATADRWLVWGPWQVTWTMDSVPFSRGDSRAVWRSGKIGEHEIAVTVESPWGTRRTASIRRTVRYASFVLPDSPKLQEPDLAALPTDPDPDDLPFGIADVWVEKSQVCQGEPTRIRLTPFDQRGTERWLVPVVAGEQAWEVAFVVPPTHPGSRMVPVSLFDAGGKGGHVDSIDTYVYIEVLDCIAPFPIFVEHRPVPPDVDNIAFRVRLYDGPAWVQQLTDPAAPSAMVAATSYRWTFGDGAVATTTAPTTTHRYPAEADRADERATSYKVRVEATDALGQVLATSFAAVEVPNHLRQLKQEQGLVQLATRQAPGSQENADGSRTAEVALTNIDVTETARISEMKIQLTSCDGRSLGETTAAPSSVFSELVIAPRATITGRFTLPATSAGVCFANAEVSGASEPGKLRVLGFFQLVTTPAPPGVALTEEQERVLLEARELLGNPGVVTSADLDRLENEGKIPRHVLTRDPFGP